MASAALLDERVNASQGGGVHACDGWIRHLDELVPRRAEYGRGEKEQQSWRNTHHG
jgi:hypothetical protein